MEFNPKVSLRTIAGKLGVSHATISRALRDDPRISKAVRSKVKKTAARMGYTRDPKMGELMSHLRRGQHRTYQGNLAWISDLDPGNPADNVVLDLYQKSAQARANELGYHIDFFLNAKPQDSAALTKILRARGIRGMVLHIVGFFSTRQWKLDWNKLAVVHVGSLETNLSVDTVDADDNGNNLSMMAHLAAKGYKRIGVATSLEIERVLSFSLSASRRRFALLEPEHECIPEFFVTDPPSPAAGRDLLAWIKQYRVDCIVSQIALAETLDCKLPKKVGIAYQGVGPASSLSGMYQSDDSIAMTAVETLANSVEQGRIGIPRMPRQILLNGVWHQGESTR